MIQAPVPTTFPARLVAPSLLSANFAHMAEGAAEIASAGADWVHLDVMDGHFVPNLTFGPKLVQDLREKCGLFFDVHLMVKEPRNFVDAFVRAGADALTFHVEAEVHSHMLLSAIRDKGKKAGISIVPSTPISLIGELLGLVDLVLVMTVNPGFGGQKIIPACLDKVAALAKMRRERGLSFLISVDGGINGDTAATARQAGADVLVTGSCFFAEKDKSALVHRLKNAG